MRRRSFGSSIADTGTGRRWVLAALSGHTAGTTLRNPESILLSKHGSAAAFRAQKFPSANSLSIALSSLQFIESLGLGGFHPAEQLLPSVISRG